MRPPEEMAQIRSAGSASIYEPVSEDTIDSLHEAIEKSGLDDWEKENLIGRLVAAGDRPDLYHETAAGFTEAMRSWEQKVLGEQDAARTEEFRKGAHEDLSKLDRTWRPQLQADINRYTAGGPDLSKDFVYRDPTYANAISSVDNSINRATQRAQANAAITAANAGVASSGKNIGAIGGMEVAGAAEKGRARAGAYEGAHQDLSAARGRLQGFDTELAGQRSAINSGYQPALGNINSFISSRPQPNWFSPAATQQDSYAFQRGDQRAQTASDIGAFNAVRQPFDNAVSAGTDFASGWLPGGRN
ncbi:MAG TPA: hypothetical protein VNT79_02230 [Phycisphaerae bacterium]|nr:hypothetical protein [Phycisphaerae bacterium]